MGYKVLWNLTYIILKLLAAGANHKDEWTSTKSCSPANGQWNKHQSDLQWIRLKLPKHQIESKNFTDVAPDELTNRTWKPLWQANDQSLGPTTRTVLSPSKRSISAKKNPEFYTNFTRKPMDLIAADWIHQCQRWWERQFQRWLSARSLDRNWLTPGERSTQSEWLNSSRYGKSSNLNSKDESITVHFRFVDAIHSNDNAKDLAHLSLSLDLLTPVACQIGKSQEYWFY